MRCYFQYDYLECISILLDFGHCDPNVQDSRGNTALHNAFICKYEACVNKLLDAGADSHIKNNDGIEAIGSLTQEKGLKVYQCQIRNKAKF